MNDRFPDNFWAICTCPLSVKPSKLEHLPTTTYFPGLAIIQRLGRAKEELRSWRYTSRVARSFFPGGLDADSDVVPAVRCQQERGVRLSAWVWDGVCALVRPFYAVQGLSHTRLMATVEVLKWMLQLLQTEAIHQI